MTGKGLSFFLLAILICLSTAILPAQTPADSTQSSTPMLGLRTTIYRVPDLTEAKAWYSKAFDKAPYFDEPFYVGFNIGGYELGLLPEEGEGPQQRGDNVLSYWGVEEIQKVYDHLISLGATEYEAPHSVGGPLMVATVKDPWGNVVGLIFNPAFKLE
ncbi:MAG: VOC family protein [Bacteroidota bacterium]